MAEHAGEVERLNRLYSALRQISQAIVRKPSRAELFHRLCEILVVDGGFGMAWVGWHNPETHQLTPIAHVGDESGDLQSIRIYADDRPEERGPSGRAFRDNQSYVCNDVFADQATSPWQDELRRRGFHASAAFPIHLNGEVAGMLSIYANVPNFFQDKEVLLLEEAAADVSFALDVLAHEEARKKAEATAERERRFANSLTETIPGILYLYDERGRFLRWNRNFACVTGYSDEEIAQMHPLDFFGGNDKAVLRQRIADVFATGEGSVEASLMGKNGSATPYFFTGRRISFDGATCLVGVGVDIAERERTQEALSKSEERYRTEPARDFRRLDYMSPALIAGVL